MLSYPETATLSAARAEYFRQTGLSLDGYGARWEKIRIGPVWFPLPNTKARARALPLHDLHHIATGYDTSWRGEAEIAAWELGAGCGRYSAAWLLNLGGFPVGLVLAPRRLWRAFHRGRNSDTLYREQWQAAWLDDTVRTLQDRLGLHRPAAPASVVDRLLFAACAVPAVGVLGLLALGALAIAARVWSSPPY